MQYIFYTCRPSPKQDFKQERSSTIPSTLGGSASTGGSTSFQDFQESVDDAWDSGDDEFCVVSDVKISKRVSQSAALSVINYHRSSSLSNHQDIISEEKKTQVLPNSAVQPLHLKNANCNDSASKYNSYSHHEEVKSGAYQRHTQFPGRPQPMRQANCSAKFFVPSKEQGDPVYIT